MTDAQLCKIAYTALCKACKFMRISPPGNLDEYTPDLISCLVGGMDDPEGMKFVHYFLNQAMAEELSSDE